MCFLCRGIEKPEDDLVHAEHDCCAGNGSKQVGGQAAVETDHALLLPDELETLDQTGVFGSAVCHWCLP